MHRITDVNVNEISRSETGYFIRELMIESEDGDFKITLFSDNRDNLIVSSDTRTLE